MTSRLLKTYLPLLAVFLVFAGVLTLGVRTHSQSWYFQDENDHLTLGWMMYRFDRPLYSDLVANHQPIPYLVGAAAAELIPYKTLFQFTEQLRLSMVVFHGLAAVIIIGRFKWRGLLASILYLSVSYYYFGWYVLAESLVAPAVVFSMLQVLSILINKRAESNWLDSVLFAFSQFWIAFSLLTMWPFVAVSTLLYVWKVSGRQRVTVISVGLLLSAVLFLIINPIAWFESTVINNLLYFIPSEVGSGGNYFQLLVYPWLHFLRPANQISQHFIGFLLPISVFLLVLVRRNLRSRFSLLLPAICLSLLLLLNPRTTNWPVAFYTGFHVFPLVAGLSAMASFAVVQIWNSFPTRLFKVVLGVSMILIVSLNLRWVAESRDKLAEYHIQYNRFQSLANAITAVGLPDAELLTGPNGAGLIHLLSDTPIAGQVHFHLPWAYRALKIRTAWQENLASNPPEWIYFNQDNNNGFWEELQPILVADYVQLQRPDNSFTDLYLSLDVVDDVPTENWQLLEDQFFLSPALVRSE